MKKLVAHTGHDLASRAAHNGDGTPTIMDNNNEGDELARREEIIDRGLRTYVEVGILLTEIRDQKLYRLRNYSSFETYCYNRWNFGRVYGWRICQEAKLALALQERGFSDVPQAHVRELLPLIDRRAENPGLDPAIDAYVATVADTDGPPQAKHLARAVRAMKAARKAPNLEGGEDDGAQPVIPEQNPCVDDEEKPSSVKVGNEVNAAASVQKWISELQACRSSAEQLKTLLVGGKVKADRLELLEQVFRSLESVLGSMAGTPDVAQWATLPQTEISKLRL